MLPQTIRDFMNLDSGVADALINAAISEANRELIRKNITPDETNEDHLSALKYLSAYFLIPHLTTISGDKGITKDIGFGDNAQKLISDSDVERRQAFYYNHALKVIENIVNTDYPFGIDIPGDATSSS
jgi:hypothetical protein